MSTEPKTPEQIKAEYAPRIAAAARAATERRDAAYVDVPCAICRIPVRAMSLADYNTLVCAGNAHLTDQPVPEGLDEARSFWALHDAAFLWFLSLDYLPEPEARAAWIDRRAIHQLDLGELHEGIATYLQETFADAPRGAPASGSTDTLRASFMAVATHRLAAAYGWSRADIRAMPLKEVFQQLRVISAEEMAKAGKHPLSGGDEMDRLWAEMLREINALRAPA